MAASDDDVVCYWNELADRYEGQANLVFAVSHHASPTLYVHDTA